MNIALKISVLTLFAGVSVYYLKSKSKLHKLSSKGAEFIKKHEGLRLTAYPDGGKGYSIGYGHYRKGNEQKGLTISQAKADAYFAQDIKWVENLINSKVTVSITQNMYDALASFIYNRGSGTFTNSTVLQELNKGNYAQAAKNLLDYDAGYAALKRRRAEESQIFRA